MNLVLRSARWWQCSNDPDPGGSTLPSSQEVVPAIADLSPCCTQSTPPPLETCVGDWGHDLETLLSQFDGHPGDECFEAAVRCGLSGNQPYHGDGGVPEFHPGVHDLGEGCVTCDLLGRRCNGYRYDSGEARLVLRAECPGGEDNRDITSISINGVPFSQVGFLHDKSCACAVLAYCPRTRAGKCNQETRCMAVAAKPKVPGEIRVPVLRRPSPPSRPTPSPQGRSVDTGRIMPSGALPHDSPLVHKEDPWTLEELCRRELAAAEDRTSVLLTEAEWNVSRDRWLNEKVSALRTRALAFMKARKAGYEEERALQLTTDQEEIERMSHLFHQQRLAGLAGPSALSVAALALSKHAMTVQGQCIPLRVLKLATSEAQLLEQAATEAHRAATAIVRLTASKERIRALETSLRKLNATAEVEGSIPPIAASDDRVLVSHVSEPTSTASSVTMSRVPATPVLQAGPSLLALHVSESSVSVSSALASNISYCPIMPIGSPVITGVPAPPDSSGDSSVASIAITYCGVVKVGEPTVQLGRRLSIARQNFADEQASGTLGGLKRSLPTSSDQNEDNKKGKSGSSKHPEDHKKDEGDKEG